MSRKPTPTRARVRRADTESNGDGLVAEFIDRTFENPAMSGGLMVMALTATAIVSNAMFLQSGQHPDPLFTTRPSALREVMRPAPIAPRVPVRPDRIIENPPMPRPSPRRVAAAIAQPPQPPLPVPSSAPLITEIQRELARLGLYSGAIDGLIGARTQSAIAAFETAAGRTASGLPTADLLDLMKQPLPPRPSAGQTRDLEADSVATELDRRGRQRAELIAAQERDRAAIRAGENRRVVQAALNRIGYGPLPIDGADSQETSDAIRRFELDNGMPITGEASEALIGRLISIGAVKPG